MILYYSFVHSIHILVVILKFADSIRNSLIYAMDMWKSILTFVWILCDDNFRSGWFNKWWNDGASQFSAGFNHAFIHLLGSETSSWTTLTARWTSGRIRRSQNFIVVVFDGMFFIQLVTVTWSSILSWRTFFEWTSTCIRFRWWYNGFFFWIKVAIQNVDQFTSILFFYVIQLGYDLS